MKCICHEHKPVCDCVPANESKPDVVIIYVFWALFIGIIVILGAIFLSSRRAEASHGPAGQSISYCCRATNPKSGISYRTIAAVIQPYRYTSVFEVGTQEIEYILQWPELEPTTQQLIRAARQRLRIVMVHQQELRSSKYYDHVWYGHSNAIGMACLAGGLMLAISLWPYRKY